MYFVCILMICKFIKIVSIAQNMGWILLRNVFDVAVYIHHPIPHESLRSSWGFLSRNLFEVMADAWPKRK